MKIEADITVQCEGCNTELDLSQDGRGRITASPCAICMKESKTEGHDEGYSECEKERG